MAGKDVKDASGCQHQWEDDWDTNTRYCTVCGVAGEDDLEHYDKDAIGESFGQREFIHQLASAQPGRGTLELSRYQQEKLRESSLQVKDVCMRLDMASHAQRVIFIMRSALEYSKKPRRQSAFKFGKQSLCFEMAAIKYVAAEDAGKDLSYEEVSTYFSHLVAEGNTAVADEQRSGKPRITKLDVGRQTHFIEWLARYQFRPGADDDYIAPGFEALKMPGEEGVRLAQERVKGQETRKESERRLGKRKREEEPVGQRADYIDVLLDGFDRDLPAMTAEIPALADEKEKKTVEYLKKLRKKMKTARELAAILVKQAPPTNDRPRDLDIRSEASVLVLLSLQAAVGQPAPKNTLFYPMITRMHGVRAPSIGKHMRIFTDWLNNQLFAQPWFDTEEVFAPAPFRSKKTTNRSGNAKAVVVVAEWQRLIEEGLKDTQVETTPLSAVAPTDVQVTAYRLALQRAKVLVAVWKMGGGTPPPGISWGEVYERFPPSLWKLDIEQPKMPMADGRPLPSLRQQCIPAHADIERYIRYLSSEVPLKTLYENPLARIFARSFEMKLMERLADAGGMSALDDVQEDEELDKILFEPEELEALLRSKEEAEYYEMVMETQVKEWEEHNKINTKKLDDREKKKERQSKKVQQEEVRAERKEAAKELGPRVRQALFEDDEDVEIVEDGIVDAIMQDFQ